MTNKEGVPDLLRLDGQVCVVTGGARGIGAAIVSWLETLGARCVVADIDCSDDEENEDRYRLDVTDSDAVAAVFDDIKRRHGHIDVLVTCAGVTAHGPTLELGDESWNRTLAVNATGSYICVREACRRMPEGGAIVCIGSISGDVANVPQYQTAYNASKAAVHSLVQSFAIEFAKRGIRVNAVAPGYVRTEMTSSGVPEEWISEWTARTPLGRMAHPHEIASVVGFLACRAASYVTGSVYHVDGGYTSA